MKDKSSEEKSKKEINNKIASPNKNAQTNDLKIQTTTNQKSPKNLNNDSINAENKEKDIKIGNYLIKKTLGKGTFGKVKLGIYLPKNKKVAIKILEKKRLKEEDDLIRLKREFEMLSQFNHPNVITVSEIFESSDAYFTVMEYCDGGELFNYIVKNKYLSEEKSAFFYYQLINGLEYIHSLGIVHRDLKPENLLLTQDEILKIIDFGLSNYFKSNQLELLETPCGSPCYASPEMLSGENYDGFKIDIWATGIILFAMLCGYLPFDHKDNDKLFMKILECKIQYPKNLSKESKDLLKKILIPDPRRRITIAEIKRHPFYLKGKEIFESSFTIYQVSQDELTDSDESSSFNYITLDNNLFFYENNHKSEVLLNKYNDIYSKNLNLKKKRYNSMEINGFNFDATDKKLIDLEKKMKKLKKKSKRGEGLQNRNASKKRKYLKYNHSLAIQINDICLFCENLIEQYKKEERIIINKKPDDKKYKKNKNNENKQNNTNINNKSKQKSNNSKNKNNKNDDNYTLYINLKNIIEKIKISKPLKERDKEKDKTIKNTPIIENKKEHYINNAKQIHINKLQNKKFLNQTQNINNNNYNAKNNIKVNLKKRAQIKINKLYINNNKISKVNKLPQNIKLKHINRRIKSTSTNNSKAKNFKNILNVIKQQSLKTNINIIDKQNIIHHYTTNITNMTQKNYFSNVIINNFKSREEHKNYSTSQNKSKGLDISEIQNDKNIINDYLQKFNISDLSFAKKYNLKNNWKLKNNLQKLNLKEEILFKKASKHNSQNKNSIDVTGIANTEDKYQNYLTIRNKKSNKKTSDSESKTIPNTNDKKKRHFKKMKNVTNNSLNNNNIKYHNKCTNTENSFGYSLKSMNNIDFMNLSKKDKFLNSYINTNNSVESKDVRDITQNTLYKKKKLDKLLTANINFNLNLDKKLKRNKINNSSIDNNFSNRSYNYNYNNVNNFDKNKTINNSNLIYNNNSAIKKIENIKKNNLYFKNNLNYKKSPKLNLKDIFGIDSISKRDTTSISINYQKQVQSQRNKPTSSMNNNNQKNADIYHYLNSVRSNESKISDISYNIENNHFIGNISSNSPHYSNHIPNISKFKANQNIMRNIKELININNNNNNSIYSHLNKNNIVNITNDNLKTNSNIIKIKNSLYSNQVVITNPNSNNVNYNIINKNPNKNRINSNIYLDKYVESKKFFSSLKKRINFKSHILSNNTFLDNKKAENKSHNSSIKNKETENKKTKNNSLIANYTNTKQFKNNNNAIDNKNNANKNSLNYNLKNFKKRLYETSMKNEKKIHKKIKSMKDTLNLKSKTNQNKFNHNIKNLNIEINNANDIGLYICNTEGNSNTVNYINILDNKLTTIDNNKYTHHYQFSNLNNNKKNKIIKK